LEKYPNLVHAPEFLTAVNANSDYYNGTFSIVGGNKPYIENAYEVIKFGQKKIESNVFCSIGEASLSKYTINCFLSTKVMFMNEISFLATNLGYDYSTIEQCILQDSRIGQSHTKVPGPDGQYGFGGACFPKDTSALLAFAKSQGTTLDVYVNGVRTPSYLTIEQSTTGVHLIINEFIGIDSTNKDRTNIYVKGKFEQLILTTEDNITLLTENDEEIIL
jgi:UDP-glucose 6-dehydrogenase